MRSPPRDIVDLASTPATAGPLDRPGPRGPTGRPWLSIRWRCCSTYGRAYRNAASTAYEGRCPRCGQWVRVTIGEGGTSCRFFETG